tara:strand:+ start:228148 stop:228852 length:705 start_codon:yes stop_codon:yes gene_type:complete
MSFPTITKTNKTLIIILISSFLIDAILAKAAGFSLSGITGLRAASVESGFIWQLLTYPLVPTSLFEILFEAMMLWFIGSELENLWGTTKYLKFLLACLLGGTVLYVLSTSFLLRSTVAYQVTLSGPAGICSALAVAYGILFPERTMYLFLFPVKAKWFVGIIVAMSLYQGIFSPFGLLSWCQLGNIAAGYLWMLSQTKNSYNLSKLFGSTKRKKGHLKIVKDNEDKDDNDITYH